MPSLVDFLRLANAELFLPYLVPEPIFIEYKCKYEFMELILCLSCPKHPHHSDAKKYPTGTAGLLS